MRPLPAVPMPLSVGDWRRACAAGPEAPEELAEACRARHEALAAFSISTGRSALWLALKALKKLRPERNRVILPAYTCPTVGRAIQAAELQGLCADVSLDDFTIAPAAVERLLDETVLAVVAPHMFGMAGNVQALSEQCRRQGVVLIEDLAQACGAQCQGRAVGTFGGLAFNSLGRSKNVRGYTGSVLWVNEAELVESVAHEYENLPGSGDAGLRGDQLKQLAIVLLSQPHAWNVARRLPLLQVGAEDQDFEEHPTRLSPWQAALGSISLQRVDKYNAIRKAVAATVLEGLAGIEGIVPQVASSGCDSTYLRLGLRVMGPAERRDALVRRLQGAGIDARAFYTRVMYEYEWWGRDGRQGECPAAKELLAGNLVLPMHFGTGSRGIRNLTQVLRGSLQHGA
jgi:perosamine synthetase